MQRRSFYGSLIFFCAFVGFTMFELPTLFAQDDVIYLPNVSNEVGGGTGQPSATATQPSGSTPTATASATVAATVAPTANNTGSDFWNPPPTATPTATPQRTYPDWVPGTYNIRQATSEGWAEFREDGTFLERQATFGSADILTWEGDWFVTENEVAAQLVVEYTNQDKEFVRQHYIIERVGDGDFRLSAGDAKSYSFLYEHVTPITAFDGENVSRWVEGRWNLTVFLDFYSYFFAADGTYEMYRIYSFEDPEGSPDETGRWSAWADKMIIQPDGESLDNSTYKIVNVTDGFLNLTGGRFGEEDEGFLRGSYTPPESMRAFEGHYTAGSTTVNVKKQGDDTYVASILDDGQTTKADGTIDEFGRLVLTTPKKTYDPLLPHFNALSYDSFDLPRWLVKMSSTALPLPQGYHGLWVNAGSSTRSEKWLLPDGRYVDKFGELQTEGTYTVNGDNLIFDPLCASPSPREHLRVENQLVFPSRTATVTYHYVPLMLPDLMASVAARDEREAIKNLDFAKTMAPLGIRDGKYVSPAVGEISVDTNHADVFDNPVVFEDQQLYTWPQEIFYYLDNTGSLVGINPAFCAFNSCAHINFSKSWQDKFHYWLFPNGRVLYYHESYLNAVSTTPVTPTVTRAWGKYKIENETIIIQTDLGENLEFSFTIGRRRAMFGEICFENFEWTSEEAQ